MKNLISIYMAICLTLTLTGVGQVSKDDVSNYLIEKQIINANEVFPDNQLIDLKKNLFEKKVLYYDFIYRTRPVIEKVRIGIFENKIYAIPQDFNLLINDLDKHDLTKEQRVLMLLKIMLNPNDSIELKKNVDTSFFNIKYKYEVITWSKINGIRSNLYFSFEENKIRCIYEVILDVFIGNFETNDNVLTPGKGHHNIYNLFTNLSNKNSKSQTVTVYNWEDLLLLHLVSIMQKTML
jgi:hypothetical protein